MPKKYPFEPEAFSVKRRPDYAGLRGLWMQKRTKSVGTRKKIQNEFHVLWKNYVTKQTPKSRPQAIMDQHATLVEESLAEGISQMP